VIGYKIKDKEFVKVDSIYIKTESSKNRKKLQSDSSVKFGLGINTKGNKYILPPNFYGQESYMSDLPVFSPFTKSINANFNISYRRTAYNAGCIFYCKDTIAGSLYLGQTSWFYPVSYAYHFRINKFSVFGVTAGIRNMLDGYNRKIKSFFSFQYSFLAYTFEETKIFNGYPGNLLSSTAIWKYKNHEIDLGYLTNIKIVKNLEVTINAGISVNTVIFYNLNNEFSVLDYVNPKYKTTPGLFFIAGLVYNFKEITKK